MVKIGVHPIPIVLGLIEKLAAAILETIANFWPPTFIKRCSNNSDTVSFDNYTHYIYILITEHLILFRLKY